MPAHRIVSLIPSGTEIVAALGFQQELVGRSHECDFPRGVERLPVCTHAEIDVRRSSREIEDEVRSRLKEAVSLYSVFDHELARLQPTLIVTQAQCEVCAVSLRDVEEAVCRMIGSRPGIVSLEPMGLSDVWEDIRRVASALDAQERSAVLVEQLQRRLQAIRLLAAKAARRPRVACIEWIDPLMAAGNWVPELAEIAGGENLFGQAGRHSSWMKWQELFEADPDVIVAMPCGFDMARCRQEMSALVSHSRWRDLRAVQTQKVFLVDGNQYFNRPGPRLVESAEILAEILHPEVFQFGNEGTGWCLFTA